MLAINGVPIAILYTRVSTDDQAKEGVSLDVQLSECRRYGGERGWLLGSEHQDVLSGTRDNRPAYLALLAEVRRLRAEGRQVVVVVLRLDRFGRRVLERVRCFEELKALGVAVHSVREGGQVPELVANILASVAQEEVRLLGRRVSDARCHLNKNGWAFPGRCPWGYRWREATAEERAQGAPRLVLDVNEVTAPIVREAFARIAAGESATRVAGWVAGLPAELRGGRAMPPQTLLRLLRSPTYVTRPPAQDGDTGDVLERPRGRWPAILDETTWCQAQARLADHARLPHQASRRYLLTGMIRCPRCGARMAGQPIDARARRYRCVGRYTGGRDFSCTATANGEAVDVAVLDQVGKLVDVATTRDARLRAGLERAWEALRRPAAQDEHLARVRQLEGTAERARKGIARAAVLFAGGDLDRQGYELASAELRTELDAADAELTRLRGYAIVPTLPALGVVLAQVSNWAAVLRGTDNSARREVLALLIERVVPMRVARNTYEAEVTWTPLGQALSRLGRESGEAA